jgi:sulfur-carrier protein
LHSEAFEEDRAMAIVHIPNHMRHATGGAATVALPGGRLGKVIDALIAAHPGLRDEIMLEGHVRPDIAIAIDSTVTANSPLEDVPDDAEVHLVPAIAGGSQAGE